MKTLRILASLIALCCVASIAQAPNIQCSVVNGFGLSCASPTQIYANYTTEGAGIIDASGRATGFVPGALVVSGRTGLTIDVPYLRPDGTTGVQVFVGGALVALQ